MIDFTFQNPTRIHFGKTALSHLPKEVERYGKRVLLVYGGGTIKRIGVYDQVTALLGDAGVQVWELPGVQPNPLLSLVYKGIDLCRQHDIQLVLAVGGGSVIDTAKAICNGACYNGDVWDFFMGKAKSQAALPLGTVLTIPAAGSEMSSACVITRDEDKCKCGHGTPLNLPKFSILNPEYSYSLPPYQTACGIVDIMAHMFERYFTQTEHVELTDRLIEGALRTVINNAPIVFETPTDYDARAEIMWTGAIAHNMLLETGRTTDWASHKMEHELSALYGIAHGHGLAILIPAWMQYVLPRSGEKKLAQFALRVWDVPQDFGTQEEIAKEGIARLTAFYHSLGLTTTLRENQIGSEHFDSMAKRCVALVGGPIGGLVKLDVEDCKAIYELAL